MVLVESPDVRGGFLHDFEELGIDFGLCLCDLFFGDSEVICLELDAVKLLGVSEKSSITILPDVVDYCLYSVDDGL